MSGRWNEFNWQPVSSRRGVVSVLFAIPLFSAPFLPSERHVFEIFLVFYKNSRVDEFHVLGMRATIIGECDN